MRRIQFKSIQSRFLTYTVGMILIFSALRIGIAAGVEHRAAQLERDREMSDVLSMATVTLSEPLWDYNTENIDRILEQFFSDRNLAAIVIMDHRGRVLASRNATIIDIPKTNSSVLKRSAPIVRDDERIGTVEIRYYDHAFRMAFWQKLMALVFTTALEVMLLFAVISFVTRRLTRSVESITETAEGIALGKYESHFVAFGSDEIGRLSLALFSMQRQMQKQLDALREDQVLLQEHVDNLNAHYTHTLTALANAIEASDLYTKGHCERVAAYAGILAEALELPNSDLKALQRAAILHDIGKIAVPDHVLNKEERLTDDEFALIRNHCVRGYDIIKEIGFLQESSEIVLMHHERYDGKGYPRGLKGKEIPLLSRILSVADVYDAMTSSRAYRKQPLTHEAAMAEIQRNSGTQFDPDIVSLWMRCFSNA